MEVGQNMWRRLRLVVYRGVLPALTVLGLLVVSQRIAREPFSGSQGLDLLARIWIALIMCANFYVLADIRRYERWFCGARPPETRHDIAWLICDICTTLILFALALIITQWSVRVFLPNLAQYAVLIGVSYAVLSALPVALLPRE